MNGAPHRIRIKRIYESPEDDDGKRLLVDRLWPRGVSKERAALDGWPKEVAPSPDLRKWFNHEPERFPEFSAGYQAELDAGQASYEFATQCRTWLEQGNVTLLYAAKDPVINHASVLRDWLERKIG